MSTELRVVWQKITDWPILKRFVVDNRLPQQQITRNADRICVHLIPYGCSLNRRERPFICTWYICAAQKGALMRQHHGAGKEIFAFIAKVKTARKDLENLFVDAVE